MRILNGTWKLATDPDNAGRGDRWFEAIRPEAQDAPVPGVIQQVYPGYHGVAWYWHTLPVGAPTHTGGADTHPVRRGGLPGRGLAEREPGRLVRGWRDAVRV